MPIGSEARRANEALTAEGFGAGSLSPEIMQLFQQFMQSPAGQAALQGANQLGNTVNSQTATNLGRSGLSTTGVGAVRSGLAAGAGQNAKLQAQAGFFGQAVGAAGADRSNRLNAFINLINTQKKTESQGGGVGGFFKSLGANLLGGGANLLTGGVAGAVTNAIRGRNNGTTNTAGRNRGV